MIEQAATVVAVEGEYALVEASRVSSCDGCSANGGCGTALLAKVFGNRRSVVRVVNSVRAERGDRVVLGLPERALTFGSLLLYIFPLFTMILGAGAGRWIGMVAASFPAEPLSIAGGVLGLAMGILSMNRVGSRFGVHRDAQAVIVRAVPAVAVPLHAIEERNLES